MQPFSGRPRRSTPGLLRKPTRGIVPSTLLRLWEGQCLHKAAPRQRGGPASFSHVSTRFFQTRKPARSQPEASQKPTKPLFLIARSEAIDWAASQAHAWNCAIYFASFVGGAVPPQGRPQAAGRSSQFQPGKYEIFPGRGTSNQKASQKQPEASQKPTKPLFLTARSQPNQASRFGKAAWALQGVKEVASPHVELCHLLCFVCGRGSVSTRPPPGVQPVSAR